MTPFNFSVDVAGSFPVQAQGSYIRYYKVTAGAAAPTLRIRTDRGEEMLLAPNESARAAHPFSALMITNFDAAGTISGILQIGDGEIEQNTFTGAVSVLSTVAPPGKNYTETSFGVTNAAQQALAPNATRTYLFLQNPRGNAASVFVRCDGTNATADTLSTELQPGDVWEPRVPPLGKVSVIAAVVGPTNIHVIEA